MFISMPNINFVTLFFLHTYYFEYFGDAWPCLWKKWLHQFIEKFDAHLYKNPTSSSTSFLKYYRDFANLLFSVICAFLAMPMAKINRIHLQESLMFICMQKINFIPLTKMFLKYYKNMIFTNCYCQICYFSFFGPCLAMPTLQETHKQKQQQQKKNKKNKKKSTWSINFFLEMLHFKESCNLIGQEHFIW